MCHFISILSSKYSSSFGVLLSIEVKGEYALHKKMEFFIKDFFSKFD